MSKTLDRYKELPAMKPFIDVARPAYRFSRSAFWTISSPMHLLPDFIIIGAERSGTTSLYSYLVEHPSIGTATEKELHYFDHKYQQGLAWYRAQFPTTLHKYAMERKGQQFITGEATPNYLFHPHVPKRVARLLPRAKLIVLLRNPVSRAYSQYSRKINHGTETLSFEEAVTTEEERTRQEVERVFADEHYYSTVFWHHTYKMRGIYADQLQRWFEYFPREQFLILRSEDLYKEPGSMVKQVLGFLELPQVEPESLKEGYQAHNSYTHTQPKMDPALREKLTAYFEPHNARLYELLGRDFGWS